MLVQKVKKSCPATLHEGAKWERKYSSYSALTSAPSNEWSASRPDNAFQPAKDPPPLPVPIE
jgi:hypothetical protein